MAAVIQKIWEWFDEIEKSGDPRVKDWFLMSSPLPATVLIISYLYFVQSLGPRLMKNRKPFDLKKVMIAYNVVQVIFSAYLVEEAFRHLWLKFDYNFHCILIDYSNTPIGIQRARTVWVYFMTKTLDLLDTVFFILRKKERQASFLHIYHHTLVFAFAWFVTKFYAGGHIAFFGTINAFVHMIMYCYYLITALNPGSKNLVWWKKYLTQLQLIQFIVTGLHGILALFARDCQFPKYLIGIGIPQDIFMFLLFWDFYRKTYMRKPTSADVKQTAHNNVSKEKLQ